MARQYYYAESTAESTKTSNSFTTGGSKVTLTFTPDNGASYLILWSCLVQHNSVTAGGNQVRLNHDTASVVLGLHRQSAKDTTDYESRGGAYIYTEPGSPASQSFSIQYASEDNTTTTKIKEARVIAIKLTANDFSVTELAEETNNTTTAATKTGITVNVNADYLIIAAAMIYNNSDAGDPFEIKLTDGTTNWGLSVRTNDPDDGAPADGGGKYSWWTMVKVTTSGPVTYNIQYRNTVGTDVIGCQYSTVVALNLSDFPDYNYNESRARATSSSTTPVTKGTFTDTFAAVGGLVIGMGLLDHSVNTSSVNGRMREGGSTIGADMVKEPNVTGTSENYPFLMMKQETLPAASTTWDNTYFAEAGTSGFQESAIVVLQLDDTPGGGGGGSPIDWPLFQNRGFRSPPYQ